MWTKIVNFILVREFRLGRLAKKLGERLGSEVTEEVLMLLLDAMALAFWVDADFRKNLKDFNARYLFATKAGDFNVAVTYSKNRMRVCEKKLKQWNVRVDFSDYKAVIGLLTHPDLDILEQMLDQKLDFTGNLNYLYKLGYMLRHLLRRLEVAV